MGTRTWQGGWVSLAWKDKVGRSEVKLTQGLVVSLQVQHSWTIPSGAWTHRRAHFRGESEELVRLFHSGRIRQEALEKAGHCSPTWAVLRSLQKVYIWGKESPRMQHYRCPPVLRVCGQRGGSRFSEIGHGSGGVLAEPR